MHLTETIHFYFNQPSCLHELYTSLHFTQRRKQRCEVFFSVFLNAQVEGLYIRLSTTTYSA